METLEMLDRFSLVIKHRSFLVICHSEGLALVIIFILEMGREQFILGQDFLDCPPHRSSLVQNIEQGNPEAETSAALGFTPEVSPACYPGS